MDERLVRVVRLIADEPPRHDNGDGVAGMLRRLCSAAGRALSASGTGVSVLAGGGMRGVAAVSGPEYEPVEELQFTLGEGPCLDAFASSRSCSSCSTTKAVPRRLPHSPAGDQCEPGRGDE